MFTQKGQESAPFELLVAMVVMSFVIVIGFNALDKLSTETCKGNLNSNLESIKSGIETVVKNKSKVNVSFDLPNCYNELESKLRIISRDDQVYCSAYCGGSIQSCIVLQFSSPTYSDVKCLRISEATNFPDDSTCSTLILEPEGGYDVVNFKDASKGILPGEYTLIRQSNLFSNEPIICAYKRKGV